MSNTKNQFIDMFDTIALLVQSLNEMGCHIAYNAKEKPIKKDAFGVVRPVLMLHDTDSLAKKLRLCEQADPVVREYYYDFCARAVDELQKKDAVENPQPAELSQLAQNMQDSLELNKRIINLGDD